MRIGIVGNGVVGSATANAFRAHVDEVRVYDINPARSTHGVSDVCDCDLVFVCLPTPQRKDSLACDLTIVDTFFRAARYMYGQNVNYVLRSTVPVGTTRMLREKYGLVNLVHSPEFLTARTAEYDAANPTRMIIGYPNEYLPNGKPDRRPCNKFADAVYFLYLKAFPNVPIHEISSDESEFVKLMQNAFSSIKIAAFNEFRTFSDAEGLDWERCLDALLAGGWINEMHTQVPGPDGKRGFGGSCLPKDIANLMHCFCEAGLSAQVMTAALSRNAHIDRKEQP